ncbi:MAG: ABC transporter permease [Myxococcota bacterium]
MDPRAWTRFRKNKGAFLGLALVAIATLTAVVGPQVAPHDPNEQFRETLVDSRGLPMAPLEVPGHLLGADSIGRDELSRLLHGGAVTMLVAFLATALAVSLGTLVGILSGFFRGPVDAAFMRLVDLLLSLPFLLLAIAIKRVVADPGLEVLVLILALLSWTTLARVVRAKTLQVRELEYVLAARALGMSHGRILIRHVLPNVAGPIIVLGTTLVAQLILFESALSFLGLGVEPPNASWGSMLREGSELIDSAPRLLLYPAAFIVMTVFGFNLLGEGLRDAFDPKE